MTTIALDVRNESSRKQLYRRDALERFAQRVCAEEQVGDHVEISVLLCDDPYIQELNRLYRKKNRPTDVLSFEQDEPTPGPVRCLGDIVISLETVERHCAGDRQAMRAEISLLFCHGLLHLLGYDHGTADERRVMTRKQAHYLGVPEQAAWWSQPGH